MKYLLYFKPNKKLSDLILKQKDIILPSSGLHCTLALFYMNPEHEDYLIQDLSKIVHPSFEIETKEFSNFDNDSLVLRLLQSTELLLLHKNIVSIVESYAEPEFEEISRRYFKENYNPHLTISKSSSRFDRNSKELFEQKDIIEKFYLSRKKENNWKEIKKFNLHK